MREDIEITRRYVDSMKDKIVDYEVSLDQKQNQVSKSQEEITKLRNELALSKQSNLYKESHIRNLENKIRNLQKNSDYYINLIKIINDNPSVQGMWVSLMTAIKLVCEPEEVKKLE
jgi:chromosome segregation ATPase